MRKVLSFSLTALLGSASAAMAAPDAIKCAKNGAADLTGDVDCVRDEVLFIDGTGIYDCAKDMMDPTKFVLTDCAVDYAKAVDKALEVIKAKAPVGDTQWDQLVIFGLDAGKANLVETEAMAPLFFREGFQSGTMSKGVNEVGGIGLELVPRKPGRPFVGYIAAGGTNTMGTTPFKGTLAACGRAQASETAPVTASAAPGICQPGYNHFDALAQATGALYGPYIKLVKDATTTELGVVPFMKTALANTMTPPAVTSKNQTLQPFIWNAFLNTRGSIFGGATYRDNGNGTIETTKPSPYYGINRPFEAASSVSSGAQIPRFMPLDLYLMGFLPDNVAELQSLPYFTPKENELYRPVQGKWDGQAGPNMGSKTGVAFRVTPGNPPKTTNIGEIHASNGGARTPGFGEPTARRHIRQLWVGVVRPEAILLQGAADDAAKTKAKTDWGKLHIDNLQMFRRQFNQYFYMLTGYRGRVTTTWEGDVDDSGYFEFGQPADDQRTLQAAGGLAVDYQGVRAVPNSLDFTNILRMNTTGADQYLTYGMNAPLKLRIQGDAGIKFRTNAVTVRMRIPATPFNVAQTRKGPKEPKPFAELRFPGGPSFRIPTTCGNPAREGCDNEEGSLLADGKWHNYTADLTGDPAFVGKTFTSFDLVPSSEEMDEIEIDYIRISNLGSSKDTDKDCSGKKDMPDGWPDSEDNCPKLYNPDQADGNGDGVGDACEDFDGDTVLNACDNCPTVTNARQLDSGGVAGVGDVCEGDGVQNDSCFLMPDTLGGRMSGGPNALAAAFFAALAGLMFARRRRKR